jgi:hypothetical protein
MFPCRVAGNHGLRGQQGWARELLGNLVAQSWAPGSLVQPDNNSPHTPPHTPALHNHDHYIAQSHSSQRAYARHIQHNSLASHTHSFSQQAQRFPILLCRAPWRQGAGRGTRTSGRICRRRYFGCTWLSVLLGIEWSWWWSWSGVGS